MALSFFFSLAACLFCLSARLARKFGIILQPRKRADLYSEFQTLYFCIEHFNLFLPQHIKYLDINYNNKYIPLKIWMRKINAWKMNRKSGFSMAHIRILFNLKKKNLKWRQCSCFQTRKKEWQQRVYFQNTFKKVYINLAI